MKASPEKHNAGDAALPLSVVIATLGGPALQPTIAHLNGSAAGAPEEILVCIPADAKDDVSAVEGVFNVRVVRTPFRGQVAQRALGLTLARQRHVLQLDDDVILPPDVIGTLFETLRAKGPGNVVAPFFRVQQTGEDGTRRPRGIAGFLRSCHATLVCGAPFGEARFGKLSPAGIGYGVAMSTDGAKSAESEWLPGGVVMCFAEDLITENYFPFPGKAFSEDVMHSILGRRKGVRLWTRLDVSAWIDVTTESCKWQSMVARYRAHRHVATMIGGTVWRTRLWFAVHCLANLRRLLADNLWKRPTG
jgi:hypothetical protein